MKHPKLYLLEPPDRRAHDAAEVQANRAHKQFLARGGKWDDPTGPIYQWEVVGYMYPSYKVQFEMGVKDAVPRAIAVHIEHAVPLPAWAADAFLKAVRDVTDYRVGSWDEVFGKRVKKGQHLAALRKKHQKARLIYDEIVGVIDRDEVPIDFEAIGKKFGVGATLAKTYYREQCKTLGNPSKRKAAGEWPPF